MQRVDSKFDWQALHAHFKRVDRIGFKVCVLIGLCGFSLGPVMHTEPLAKILGVVSSISLTALAALYLFSPRHSFNDKGKGDIEEPR